MQRLLPAHRRSSLRLLSYGVLVCLLRGLPAHAAPIKKMYYVGEVTLTAESGKPLGTQALLLEKTHDPDHNRIVERAIVAKPDGGVEEHTMTMQITGDHFTLTDDQNTIHGTGTLFGPAWKWTYFKATFEAANGVKIEDENFLSDPSVATARKKVTGPDGKVILYMDIPMKAITRATFESLAACLLKQK